MIKKELYAAPETEVLEMQLQGIIATSMGGDDMLPGFEPGEEL